MKDVYKIKVIESCKRLLNELSVDHNGSSYKRLNESIPSSSTGGPTKEWLVRLEIVLRFILS